MPRRPAFKVSTEFLESIRGLIAGARETVASGVDLVQVYTNFEIGRRIVHEEQRGDDRAAYGEQIVKELAGRLTEEFGRGFSSANLKLMRMFYLENSSRIGQSVTDQFLPQIAQSGTEGFVPQQNRPFSLSWTHYVYLLTIKDPAERSFYEIEATDQNWSVRELKRQCDSGLYERLSAATKKAFAVSLAEATSSPAPATS